MKNFLPLQGLQSMKYNVFFVKKVLLWLQRKKVAQKGCYFAGRIILII